MKLLAVVGGQQVSDYKRFVEKAAPFVVGSKGYFKMNLFPMAFKNTDHQHWREAFSEVTGFEAKADYLQWCREHRLHRLRAWSEKWFPEMVVCVGKTYLQDFRCCFLEKGQDVKREVIEDRELSWAMNSNGTLVVILPFMVNRNGLVKNASIQKFGERISELRLLTSACSGGRETSLSYVPECSARPR